MSDFPQEGDLESVADDTAGAAEPEDHGYDTLEEAAQALAADDEGEPEETPEEPEVDGPEDEPEGEPVDVVTLPDGTTVPFSEYEAGQLRMADYTKKTTESAREREALARERDEFSQRRQGFETAFQNFTEFVEGLIPPPPSYDLAQQNPAAYIAAQAQREEILAEMRQVFAIRDAVNEQSKEERDAQVARFTEGEDVALQKAMPTLKDPARLAKFKDDNFAFAREFGIPDDVLAQPQPAFVHQMLHYAKIGMTAEKNRQNAARRVAEAPKKGAPAKAAPTTDKRRQALDALRRDDSIENAARLLRRSL